MRIFAFALLSAGLFVLSLPAVISGEIAIEWDRVNPTNKINGYVVRYGPSPTNKMAWTHVGDTNKVFLPGIPDGIDVFSEVVAIGLDGRVSDQSNQLLSKANTKPPAPLNLRPITNIVVITTTTFVTNITTFTNSP